MAADGGRNGTPLQGKNLNCTTMAGNRISGNVLAADDSFGALALRENTARTFRTA